MLPDRVSNPGLPTYESDGLPIALHGPAEFRCNGHQREHEHNYYINIHPVSVGGRVTIRVLYI